MKTIEHCPVCAGERFTPIFCLPKVPIFCNQYWPMESEALQASDGALDIVQCDRCSHVFNRAFDAEKIKYAIGYENSLHFSPTFGAYVDDLATHLIERYDIRNKRVLEIGCGDGGFLMALCDTGSNTGFGFDPSQSDRVVDRTSGKSVTIKSGFYSAETLVDGIDVICIRHVLEHLDTPGTLLRSLREMHKERSGIIAYFEVPNGEFCLKPQGIWDLIYEHVSYFTPQSLSYLLRSCGYRILEMGTAFDDQFLWAEVALDGDPEGAVDAEEPAVSADSVRGGYDRMIDSCRRKIDQFSAEGQRMALWGAGSKGVTFLNVADSGNAIGTVVDINPRKQSQHVAVTGQKIVAPEALGDVRPDVIFVMNSLYMNEIADKLGQLGVSAKLIPVHDLSGQGA